MKHFTKGLLCAVCVLALGAGLNMPAAAAPELDKKNAVADNAGVLSKDTETFVNNISIALQDSCGAQIGVYTTEYIGNSTMEGYAYEVFNEWGLGSSEADNGVLLLLAVGEDDYYVTRGAGLESQLSISVLGTILDEKLEPHWVNGDYDAGTQQTVEALAERLCKIYGVTMDVEAVGSGSAAVSVEKKAGVNIGAVLLIVVAVVLVIWLLNSLGKKRRSYEPPPPGAPRYDYGGAAYSRHYRNRRRGVGDAFVDGMVYGAAHEAGRQITRSITRGMSGRKDPPRRSYTAPQPRPRQTTRSSGFGSSRPRSGGFRSGGGSFRAGGGSSRGGGVGRRH